MVMDASEADNYPIQPSISASYSMMAQTLHDTTTDWAYVMSGDFPDSKWMALPATHLPSMTVLPGNHFLQQDHAPEIAAIIARNATSPAPSGAGTRRLAGTSTRRGFIRFGGGGSSRRRAR